MAKLLLEVVLVLPAWKSVQLIIIMKHVDNFLCRFLGASVL